MNYNFFEIIIPVFNSENWIKQTLFTCLGQDYPKENFLIRVSDANSQDKTLDQIKSFLPNDNLIVYHQDRRYFPLENTKFLVNSCYKNSICVLVDGDDWLADKNVLIKLNDEYNNNDIWMTCGNYAHYPSYKIAPTMESYTDYEIENYLYRKTNKWPSHLRTFKKELFEKIKEEDFKDENGNYYDVSGDVIYTYAMLEMAGKRFKYLPYVNYIYNQTNPISDFVLIPKKQEIVANALKQKQIYERLNTL